MWQLRPEELALAPYVEAAFKRKRYTPQLSDEEIKAFPACGFAIAGQDTSNLPKANHRRPDKLRGMRESVRQMDEEIGIKL